MKRLEFKYINFRGKYYPLIPVTLHYHDKSIKTLALIDSGAVLSVFRGEISDALAINLFEGEEIILQSANARFKAYTHEIIISINAETLDLKVAFSNEITTSFNIIGREGFFSHFKITFDESKNVIILEK